MATRRMFPNDPVTITLRKDYRLRPLVHGDLLPGRRVTIIYDADRLPSERSKDDNGQKAWTIQCFYKFVEAGSVRSMDLWSETGEILTKVTNELGEGTMMICAIDLPRDADHLTLWFLNTGKSGALYWDSNYGRNYIFRFVTEDLEVEHVAVEPEPGHHSQFEIAVLASDEVDSVAVLYRIMNDPTAPKEQDKRLDLSLQETADGKRRWVGSAPVPEGGVVRFTFTYESWGNSHVDTNSGKGYLTWAGAKHNREAGVLA